MTGTLPDVTQLTDPMRRLLEAAIRSPSGDNCQPWVFSIVDDREIGIDIEYEAAESFFDFGHHGTLLSLGAIIENTRLQAAAEGWATHVIYGAEGGVCGHDVCLQFTPREDARAERSTVLAMHQRTVNRRPYLPIAPSRQKLAAMLQNPVDGVGVRVIERGSEMAKWGRMIYLGDRIRYTHPTIHAELFKKILFTKAQADKARIGLEIDRLGIGPGGSLLLRLMQPWDRMQKLLRFGMDRMLAGQSRMLANMSGALVLVTIDDDNKKAWLKAGEQMQRLWILAQEQGLCVQPMTVCLYLDQRYQAEGIQNFLPSHRVYLDEMRHSMQNLLGNQVGAILFRLGYGWRMRDTAIRRPLEAFVRSIQQ